MLTAGLARSPTAATRPSSSRSRLHAADHGPPPAAATAAHSPTFGSSSPNGSDCGRPARQISSRVAVTQHRRLNLRSSCSCARHPTRCASCGRGVAPPCAVAVGRRVRVAGQSSHSRATASRRPRHSTGGLPQHWTSRTTRLVNDGSRPRCSASASVPAFSWRSGINLIFGSGPICGGGHSTCRSRSY